MIKLGFLVSNVMVLLNDNKVIYLYLIIAAYLNFVGYLMKGKIFV
ncbi:hypothetical protein BTN49_2965 [Candidatus Enterovibrio escicola]|uniref:Uncharacterized protein n=1 Tax=Candidatus Enterovibrio escicola TaxID=1927127 RepID=A0A2A5SZV6_9GAMM|nr:hypothetical protein BTN49_2965 [Candidatus Enterovibrio escacola]